MPSRTKAFDYQTYLASREWSLLREQVRERSGNTCEHCFSAPQQSVHHLTYARIGHEHLWDLMAVCNPCHEYFSGKSDSNPASWLSVTPTMTSEYWSPTHFLLPRAWNGLPPGRHRVRQRLCREGCVWCKEASDDWQLYILQFVLLEEQV